jgi:uncharacterized phage protein (TIGR02216 family)
MAFGLGRLRLPPDAFWRMTPRELAAAARAFGSPETMAPSYQDLSDLMRAYPDHEDDMGMSLTGLPSVRHPSDRMQAVTRSV